MDSDTFEKHWAVFELAARPLLDAARDRVQKAGISCGVVDIVDRDVDRGLGFTAQLREASEDADNNVSVELMLLDGDELGLDSPNSQEPVVAISVTISDSTGVEYHSNTPFNFTTDAGTADPAEIVRRVEHCAELFQLSSEVINAWGKAFASQVVTEHAQDQAKFEMVYARTCSDEGPRGLRDGGEWGTRGNALFFDPVTNDLTVVLGTKAWQKIQGDSMIVSSTGLPRFESDRLECDFWNELFESLGVLGNGYFENGSVDDFPNAFPNALAPVSGGQYRGEGQDHAFIFDAEFNDTTSLPVRKNRVKHAGAAWALPIRSVNGEKTPYESLLDPRDGIAHIHVLGMTNEGKNELARILPTPAWDWAHVQHPDREKRIALSVQIDRPTESVVPSR